jgi:hypothetical protein
MECPAAELGTDTTLVWYAPDEGLESKLPPFEVLSVTPPEIEL